MRNLLALLIYNPLSGQRQLPQWMWAELEQETIDQFPSVPLKERGRLQIINDMKTSLRQLRRAVLVVPLLIWLPFDALAQDVTGIWRTELTEEGHLEVEIQACGASTLCGTILRARDLDGNEQPYEYAGKRMIWDMVESSPTTWIDGQIWDPRDDRTYRSRMELSEGNLLVSGCVFRICQTQTWKRDF